MKPKHNIGEIFDILSDERDYQDHMCTLKGMSQTPSVEGEIVMLKTYVDKTLILWTKNPNNKAVLSEARKIAAIAIRCLQNHGCTKRDMLKGIANDES